MPLQPGQVPVVLGPLGPGSGITFHLPGQGSGTLRLEEGGWEA